MSLSEPFILIITPVRDKPARNTKTLIMSNLLSRRTLILTVVALMTSTALTQKATAKTPRQQFQSIEITSQPAGATVMEDGRVVGVTPCRVNVPVMVDLNKKKSFEIAANATRNFVISKKGYESRSLTLRAILTSKNTAYCFPASSHVELEPTAATMAARKEAAADRRAREKDPSIPKGEANNRVSRDKAGQSDLERTIIRWYFDSDPRGARIFYRVISSVPAEVKNTNETYLMTTPFEETRSFNILGLTYENSRDVQIEIKVKKKGYEDQIKRYNVRQAIDQQEISGFFDLVKQE